MSFRFAIAVAVCCAVSLMAQARAQGEALAQIETRVAQAMLERGGTPEDRLKLVEEGDRYLARNPDRRLWVKLRFIESIAHFRLRKFDIALKKADALCESEAAALFPSLLFRAETFRAVLLFHLGKVARSLTNLDRILEKPHESIPPEIVQRTQINCASLLIESGSTDAAITIYEDLLLTAMKAQDDETAMHAAANLIIALQTREDHLTARDVYERVEHIAERNRHAPLSDSIVLSGIELRAELRPQLGADESNREKALVDVLRFIARDPPPLTETMTRAYRILADIYLSQAQPRQALECVEKGKALAGSQVAKLFDTLKLPAARAHIALGDFKTALAEIEGLDNSAFTRPSRAVKIERIRLEAMLHLGGKTEEINALKRLLAADKVYARYNSERNRKHHRAQIAKASSEARQASAARADAVRDILLVAAVLGLLIAIAWCKGWPRKPRGARIDLDPRQAAPTPGVESPDALEHKLEEGADVEADLHLRRRMEAIGSLAGNVAHDFNNLLQVIRGAIQLSLQADTTEAQRVASLERAQETIDHSTAVVRKLLAYARQQELAPRALPLREYLETHETLLRSCMTRPKRLEIDSSCVTARIRVDEAQLTTALLNLLTNADEATEEGVVHLHATRETILEHSDEASSWPGVTPGDYVQIAVTDPGHGMTPEEKERALEPFFSTKGEQRGTGLGLSSVYGFVMQSGGELRITSARGRGTRVSFLLPITEATAETAAAPVSEPAHASNEKRALVVDDNQTVAATVSALLEALGFEVVPAASARQARRLLQEDAIGFELVLTDVTMPGDMDGIELAGWIDEHFAKSKVVIMTGYTDRVVQAPLPSLHKPFTLNDLRRLLAKIGAGA